MKCNLAQFWCKQSSVFGELNHEQTKPLVALSSVNLAHESMIQNTQA